MPRVFFQAFIHLSVFFFIFSSTLSSRVIFAIKEKTLTLVSVRVAHTQSISILRRGGFARHWGDYAISFPLMFLRDVALKITLRDLTNSAIQSRCHALLDVPSKRVHCVRVVVVREPYLETDSVGLSWSR